MSPDFHIAKGVKDWHSQDALLRNRIRDTLRKVFERYSFSPLETPAIERIETIEFKGGGEIQKEVFKLTDQGKRNLALRFDHTLPLARFLSSNKAVKLPFKRYTIGEVFRDGPSQPEQGRYRIFTQCDADIIGVSSMAAEAELIALANDAFLELGLGGIKIKINSRKVLDAVLDYSGVEEKNKIKALIALDKSDKASPEEIKKELLGFMKKDSAEKLLSAVKQESAHKKTFEKLKSIITSEKGKQGMQEISELIGYIEKLGIKLFEFCPSLARGLDYYTGTVFEVFLEDTTKIKSAVLGGGRFDNLIGSFMGSKQEVPAVGLSFGLERLMVVMEKTQKPEQQKTKIYIIPIGTIGPSLKIAHEIRKKGINADIDLKQRKPGQAIAHADSAGIPYVCIIGEDELKKGTVAIKNLKSKQQKEVKISEISTYLGI